MIWVLLTMNDRELWIEEECRVSFAFKEHTVIVDIFKYNDDDYPCVVEIVKTIPEWIFEDIDEKAIKLLALSIAGLALNRRRS